MAPTSRPWAIAGNFLADLTLTGSPDPAQATLRLASIAAGVIDAAWKINGRVGVIRLGQLKGSTLFLGFTPDSASNPMAGGTFSGNFKLATLRVRSLAGSTEPAFVNSVVAAPRLGTVSVQSVATANAGKSFGFLAGASIASLVVGDPFLKYNSQDQVFADFQVRLL
jgi:hypothetical protein